MPRALAATIAANRERIIELEDELASETRARLAGDAVLVHLREISRECLEGLASAKDVADVNIAAGVMLERLDHELALPNTTVVVRDGFVTKNAFALWITIAVFVGLVFPASDVWRWLIW